MPPPSRSGPPGTAPHDPVRVELTIHPDVLLDPARLREHACRAARVREERVADVRVTRRSIDARRGKPRVRVRVELYRAAPPAAREPRPGELPPLRGEPEVVIVGAGPAGLFAALRLAERGIRAHLLDRGRDVSRRRRDVAALSQRGALDPDSNYCFGEGGAGTFSDGKLYTRSGKRGPVHDVLETFVAYGAAPEILVDARPHIGTNRLPGVVGRMRAHLQSAGQQVRFDARVTELLRDGERVRGVRLHDGSEVSARAVVMATGHSAADAYAMLHRAGVALSPKPFAMGVRVEHPQAFIDRTQFGELAGHPALGAAAYRLVEHACDRSIFSFCMCPGGYIAPAATLQGQQVVNGWSPSNRRGRFANSGLVVEVSAATLAEAGFDPDDPLSGLAFQRALERRAYDAGGGDFVAPAQRLGDLVAGRSSSSLPRISYPRGAISARLDEMLQTLAPPLRAALRAIDRKLPGFAGPEGVAVGVESRTSAPLRVLRDRKTLQAGGLAGLYPAAEGAGYAGGIMSAALDGLRIADAIALQTSGAARG